MEDFDEDDYCVIIGRYIPGGCEQEICNNLDECPYISRDNIYSVEEKDSNQDITK